MAVWCLIWRRLYGLAIFSDDFFIVVGTLCSCIIESGKLSLLIWMVCIVRFFICGFFWFSLRDDSKLK